MSTTETTTTAIDTPSDRKNHDIGEGQTYTLDNAWEHARRRLGLIEASYDPGSTRRLQALGVGPGWRCLEVGAGGGSIARWLCSKVGRTGRVCAIDLDTHFIEEIHAMIRCLLPLILAILAVPASAAELPQKDPLRIALFEAVRQRGRK